LSREAPESIAWLRGLEGEMADLAATLASMESPTLDPEAQEPVRLLLESELAALGFEVTRIPGAGGCDHLLAEMPGDGPSQLLLGHFDTVWPTGTLRTMPVERRDGCLHGPGVFDMKGGLVQMLYALRTVADGGREMPCRPMVLLNCDEEMGSPDSRRHIETLARRAARAFVMEPSYGPDGDLKTGRKGVARFTLRVTGVASHAGLDPGSGASAILELSQQVERLFALNDSNRGITVNVGTIDGGMRPNIVAPEASAEIEARVVTAADAVEVEQAIRGLTNDDERTTLAVEGGFTRPPLEATPRNRELWEAARNAAATLGLQLGEARVGGASDGNFASSHTATLDGLGAVGDGAHASHEHLVMARMPERAALLAELLCLPAPRQGEGAGDRGPER
jgi:glutamate carboxypeptidase